MFLPSGRVHAIGAGLVIFEIQQNSDTTYRVFDWNRVGLDGKPRELHITESLASIDFDDFEPKLVAGGETDEGPLRVRTLANHELFRVRLMLSATTDTMDFKPRMRVVGVLEGRLGVSGANASVELEPGGFCLIPACVEPARLHLNIGSRFLMVE
jgi:mannose-6-phosphate isomerase